MLSSIPMKVICFQVFLFQLYAFKYSYERQIIITLVVSTSSNQY